MKPTKGNRHSFPVTMHYRTIRNIREPLVQRHKPVTLAAQSPERLLACHFPQAKDISAGLGSQLSSCLHVGGMGNREAFEKNEKLHAHCIIWENKNEFFKNRSNSSNTDNQRSATNTRTHKLENESRNCGISIHWNTIQQ